MTNLIFPDDFVARVAGLTFKNAFNPYSDLCPLHDTQAAPEIRRSNLKRIVESALMQPEVGLWIGRDLGYRGGRRTGLALTDEANLKNHGAMFGLEGFSAVTHGPIVSERTAATIWRLLGKIGKPIFLWNVFPFHPHMPDQPMSNRCHTSLEAQECRFLLDWLLEKLKPTEVLAIGRDAQIALKRLGIEAIGIRHPSYGGQTEFLNGIRQFYHVQEDTPQLSLL